ncbi:hypothetical protein CONLIGDRAFT_605842 [Coniochaeta ligniaria NRRL 30616]|uniref:HNH nuclease domain-containing protein n=1 Tax=Coniochaeta ligniaria NRRL 30616 TaxID=1408157 RepID=A0A1J7IZY8_9PEZI|nr:hypothetical protein CONLIGDRAFT_605842 [Coniochaeta ligniaria NRRL 30616]
MANAAVTQEMRHHGWNIRLFATEYATEFAGVFQPPHNTTMTFAALVEELQLCFQLPERPGLGSLPWDSLGFAYMGLDDPPETVAVADAPVPPYACPPLVIGRDGRQQLVPPPPEPDPMQRVTSQAPAAKYHLFTHDDAACALTDSSTLEEHLRGGCAKHIPKPTRRRHARFIPSNARAVDPRFAGMPFRRKAKAGGSRSGSQSPTKRSASSSPRKDVADDDPTGDDDVSNIVAPPDMAISMAEAGQMKRKFRDNVFVSAGKCAITGKGRSWCISPIAGPGLEACHIIPQIQYYTYPLPGVDVQDVESTQPRALAELWYSTWRPSNGILLASHLHAAFDSRLLSIHPVTKIIRVFMPYDMIAEFHGRKASLPSSVDLRAIRHHYDMCCIENMTALVRGDIMSPSLVAESVSAASGTVSPFEERSVSRARTALGPVAERPQDESDVGRGSGDPSKRPRVGGADDGDGLPPLTDASSQETDVQPSRRKRRRTDDDLSMAWVCPSLEQLLARAKHGDWPSGTGSDDEDGLGDECWDGHLTPWNKRRFLGGVDYELRKYM